MKTFIPGIIFMFAVLQAAAAGPTFVGGEPRLTRDGSNQFQVEFQMSDTTDVAVSIVNPRDSTVVRHLAAGCLGSNAPAPLVKGSLVQRIAWNGTDDLGRPASTPESLAVRVRAGMGVRLANILGDNMYVFNMSFGGIVPGPDNSVFILGSAGYSGTPPGRSSFIRQYDASGEYIRTVFPPAAGLSRDSVIGYGINVVPGGGWVPKVTNLYNPSLSNSFCIELNAMLFPIGLPGELVLVNGSNMQIMKQNGSFASAAAKQIISAPAAPPPVYRPMGPHYFASSHNPDFLYLSGWYYATVNLGSWLVNALDTGFWADGQVFRVDRRTGVVSPWLRLSDTIPVSSAERTLKIQGGTNAFATLHGVAVDDSLHVFVCDRLHNRVGVYDTNAVLVGSVPVNAPDFAAVSRRTGALYVITRTPTAMNLLKFASWRAPGAAVATAALTTSINTNAGAPNMVLVENGDTTVVWTGYARFGVRQYRDNGAAFTLVRDFSQGGGNLVYDRIAVDRKTERVYVTNSWTDLWKIEDWSRPEFVRCSTSARKPLFGGDVAVAPNGLLYVRSAAPASFTYNAYAGPIARYTQDHLHAPANYSNTGQNIITHSLFGRQGTGVGDKGLDVNNRGQVGANFQFPGQFGNYAYFTFPDTGYADTSFKGRPVVTSITGRSGGVKYDRDGNVYVGLTVQSAGRIVPPGFESDWAVGRCGSVVKYAFGDTGLVSGGQAVGASKVYPQPLGGISADGMSVCVCRSPRFDVDPYGRLFIPNAQAVTVAVADNAGNTILSFGQYGNTDSRGGLSGPGHPVAEPAIPLAYPNAVAATEDYIYINDWVNARHVRVQMTYALDNMEGLTAHHSAAGASAAVWGHLKFSSAPNPFNPVSGIRVSMPAVGTLKLAVFGADGRLVRTIADGRFSPGPHRFAWAGNDHLGREVTAGVYFYRLTAGHRTVTLKTVKTR